MERFRSDAKAEGKGIVIGGWEVHRADGTRAETHEARWFKVELNRISAPWAYRRGEPFRAIAALELLGSLLCIKVLMREDEATTGTAARAIGRISVGASTDNQGNRFILKRLITKNPIVGICLRNSSRIGGKRLLT